MITLIGGEKGGSGKSTLATNLAAWFARQGRDVLLLDADRQGTATMWVNERNEHPELPVVHCVQRDGNITAAARDLGQRYEEVVIDAGGRDSRELRTAMVAADKIYSPLRPSQSDLWTVEHTGELIEAARDLNPGLEAWFILSMAPTNPRVSEAADAEEVLQGIERLALSRAVIRDRKAYRDAMFAGAGVIELDDAKAAEEIEMFAKEVCGG